MRKVVEADPALVEQANYEALKLEEALQIAKEAALKEKRTQTAAMVQRPIVGKDDFPFLPGTKKIKENHINSINKNDFPSFEPPPKESTQIKKIKKGKKGEDFSLADWSKTTLDKSNVKPN